MIEPTQSRFDEQLARFARGELSAAEARELAQTALESPAWFEELTATALAKTATSSVPVPAEPVRHSWWRSPFLLAAAAVIVIGILVLPYVMRILLKQTDSARTSTPQSPAIVPLPTTVLKDGSSQPVLLAEGLVPAAPTATQVFRGEEEPARLPRQIGAIVEIDDGQATIDLGSLDGLGKGTGVEIYRDKSLKHRIGTLTIGTVFRDRARGDAVGTAFKTQCLVRVSDRDHLEALLQFADDSAARGDFAGGRRAAAQANEWATTAQVSTAERAHTAELLAKLDFQTNDLAAAETHYGAALEIVSADANASADAVAKLQNNVAAVAMLRGDYSTAQKVLDRNAVGLSNKKLQAERLNNLGVLAEENGDRNRAAAFYDQALELLSDGSADERKIVEVNLNRVKGLH